MPKVGKEGDSSVRQYELPNSRMLRQGDFLYRIRERMAKNWRGDRFNPNGPTLLARPISEKEQS